MPARKPDPNTKRLFNAIAKKLEDDIQDLLAKPRTLEDVRRAHVREMRGLIFDLGEANGRATQAFLTAGRTRSERKELLALIARIKKAKSKHIARLREFGEIIMVRRHASTW